MSTVQKKKICFRRGQCTRCRRVQRTAANPVSPRTVFVSRAFTVSVYTKTTWPPFAATQELCGSVAATACSQVPVAIATRRRTWRRRHRLPLFRSGAWRPFRSSCSGLPFFFSHAIDLRTTTPKCDFATCVRFFCNRLGHSLVSALSSTPSNALPSASDLLSFIVQINVTLIRVRHRLFQNWPFSRLPVIVILRLQRKTLVQCSKRGDLQTANTRSRLSVNWVAVIRWFAARYWTVSHQTIITFSGSHVSKALAANVRESLRAMLPM